MISLRKVSGIAEKFGKKIGRNARERIEKMILEEAERKIKKAARNADFAGRKIIKEEDIE